MNTTTTPHTTPPVTRRLERPREGRVLAGVAAGIAERTGASVGLVRLGFIVATLFAGFGALVYLAGWLLMPNEAEEQSLAERWLEGLRTPGRRVSSVLVGVAGLLVVAATAPVAVFAALAVLIGAAVLGDDASADTEIASGDVASADSDAPADTAGPSYDEEG